MATTLSHLHAALNFTELTDADRQSILSGIQQVAPTSSLYAGNAALQACFTSLVKQGGALMTSSATVAADKKKLSADAASHVATRTGFDQELRLYAAVAESAATSATDLEGLGLKPRSSSSSSKSSPPAVPSSIAVHLAKRHGAATRVSAQYAGTGRPHFVAESSPDPVTATSFTALPGAGRSRSLTGASGTRVWVRFASVRGGMQSDWCTPVLVTLP